MSIDFITGIIIFVVISVLVVFGPDIFALIQRLIMKRRLAKIPDTDLLQFVCRIGDRKRLVEYTIYYSYFDRCFYYTGEHLLFKAGKRHIPFTRVDYPCGCFVEYLFGLGVRLDKDLLEKIGIDSDKIDEICLKVEG